MGTQEIGTIASEETEAVTSQRSYIFMLRNFLSVGYVTLSFEDR